MLWAAEGPEGEGRVLLDPNRLGEDGTTALAAIAVARRVAELVACATSDAGSDWRTWGVRLVGTGEELPDRIAWSKFSSAAWTHDDAGFFYGRYPEPAAGRRLRRAEQEHGAPLPPPRHGRGRGSARLRHAARAGVGLRARGLRRWPVPGAQRLARHGPGEPDLRRGPRAAGSMRPSCGRCSTRPTRATSPSA